jgi:hypothetical protein
MRLPLAASMVILAGCSAVVDDVPGDGAQDQETAVRASVSIQRTETVNGTSQGLRTHVAARFLRATGALDAAERVVDGGIIAADAPAGCAWREDAADASAPSAVGGDGMVELLDVGEIVLHASREYGASTMALAPRAFPDVGGLVSGVVYTSRDGRRDLPDAATYLFEVSGSSALDGVRLEADAPSAPEQVRLGEVDIGGADLMLRAGETVELGWLGSADDEDRIVVTVDEADGQAFVCVFEDDGAAEIPGSFVAFEPGAELDVMVHRHRRASLDVTGTDYDAVVDFDFAVAAQATVE